MKTGYWVAAAAASLLMTPQVQPRNHLKLPSFYEIAEVRASIPGRIRLNMPAVTANPEVAAQMKKQMEETGAVHEVSINPAIATADIRKRRKPEEKKEHKHYVKERYGTPAEVHE